MLNTSQNTKHTRRTFTTEGIAPNNELTTTRMPSKRDKARNGRRTLRVRRILTYGALYMPKDGATTLTTEL